MDNFTQTYIGKDERACPYCNLILSKYEVKNRECHYCYNSLPEDFA